MNYRIFAVFTLLLAPLLAIVADSMSGNRHNAATAPMPAAATPTPTTRTYPSSSTPLPQPIPEEGGDVPAFWQPMPGAGEPMMPLGVTDAPDAPDDAQNASR